MSVTLDQAQISTKKAVQKVSQNVQASVISSLLVIINQNRMLLLSEITFRVLLPGTGEASAASQRENEKENGEGEEEGKER